MNPWALAGRLVDLIAAVTDLIDAAANRLSAGEALVIAAHHHLHVEPDESCDCDDPDPDAPERTLVLLPIETAQELFAEAIRRSDNGALADDVAWDMARSLELGGDVA